MKRRDLVLGGGAVLLTAGLARAEDPHTGHGAHGAAAGDGAAKDPHAGHGAAMKLPVLPATLACESLGEECVAHCFDVIAKGDTSIVGCARAVHEMLAVNDAVLRLAGSHSTHLKGVATATVPVYRACEAECRKHEAKHDICKLCGDACVQAVKAIGELS